MTNRKSHTRFRLVPKSTTLDDLEGPLRTLFQNTYVFGAHHEYLNEDRLTLSAAKMESNESSFWQYKVYADIRGFLWIAGFPGEGTSNDSGVVENGNLQYFRSLFLHKLWR